MTGSGKQGLTRETFLAILQTTKALVKLTKYLLEEEDFAYVMLGHLQSDPLEKRFGWYRSLGGAVYFVSVRQILEAEKCIRLRALLKFSGLSLSEVKKTF